MLLIDMQATGKLIINLETRAKIKNGPKLVIILWGVFFLLVLIGL
jgi:hypothetical protein